MVTQNMCECKEKSLSFDLFKAFDKIEIGLFLEKPYFTSSVHNMS